MKNIKQINTAVSYNRKSTEDAKKQVQSIDDQKRYNQKHAKELRYELVEEFEEEKSASKLGRIQFAKMIENIQVGKYDTIFCWKADRLARNPKDGGDILWLLQQGIIKKIITSDREYTASDTFLLTVEFGMATQYTIDLGKNVKRGLKSKAEKGFLPGVAPLGYKNDWTGEKGKKTVMIDKERFTMIRRMFDLMLTGTYTITQILNIANEEWGFRTPKGNKLGKSSLYYIFTKPFYYGEFEYDGILYKGAHTPMITIDEYDRIQIILGRKGKPRPQSHDFPYTGLIRCDECGCMITAEDKYKKLLSGQINKHTYYHCTYRKADYKCNQRKYMSQEDLEKEIGELFDNLEVPQEYIDWAERHLKEAVEADNKTIEVMNSKFQKDYDNASKMLSNLIDMKVSFPDSLTEGEFMEKKDAYTKEKERALNELNKVSKNQDEGIDEVLDMLNFFHYARQRFDEGDLETRKMISQRFGSTLRLLNKKLYPDSKSSIFTLKKGIEEIAPEFDTFELEEKSYLKRKFPPVEEVSSKWLDRWDDFRKLSWFNEVKYPEYMLKVTTELLSKMSISGRYSG